MKVTAKTNSEITDRPMNP